MKRLTLGLVCAAGMGALVLGCAASGGAGDAPAVEASTGDPRGDGDAAGADAVDATEGRDASRPADAIAPDGAGPEDASSSRDASSSDASSDTSAPPDASPTGPATAAGAAIPVCAGPHHPPTIAAGSNRIVVGCMPSGSQNATPAVSFFDAAGAPLLTQTLLTADGYYYTDIQLGFEGARAQVLYQYNCTDRGSWSVGWGWGCVNFREYALDGTPGASLVYGQRGHNGHPVMAAADGGFGTAWVSYDTVFFRSISATRQLAGAPGDNLRVGQDPNRSDDRNGARTKIAWSAQGGHFGVFSIIGRRLFFARVTAAGLVDVPLTNLGPASSQTFGGQFSALASGGDFFVVYNDGAAVKFARVSAAGSVIGAATLPGTTSFFPTMFERDGLFYLFTNDAADHGVLAVVDANGQPVAARSGLLDEAAVMKWPTGAWDPVAQQMAVAYVDTSGGVSMRRFQLPR